MTNVLLAPLYPPVLLAKQVTTLADVSQAAGSSLGLGIGSTTPTTTPRSAWTIGERGALLDETAGRLLRDT